MCPQIWKPAWWTSPGKHHSRAAAALGAWQRCPVLPAHPSDTHQDFIKLSSPALMNVKEHRRNTGFNCSQQQSAAQQLGRATYPEVAQAAATPTPHLEKRTANGKRNCVFRFFLLLLLTSWYHFSDRSQHFSKGHTKDLCSSQLFFFLTWGSGQWSQRILSSIKTFSS